MFRSFEVGISFPINGLLNLPQQRIKISQSSSLLFTTKIQISLHVTIGNVPGGKLVTIVVARKPPLYIQLPNSVLQTSDIYRFQSHKPALFCG